ncbi:hypothetical protein FOL47_003558 [Perkinsus chesapeaki]|uniref:Uncharacterized protein n=1 Tax=Perkinsus chesapeaki TaxID=330153 RepID=A0A7J6M8J0_PERCH|nr:hypothetical protein FOL47_003558 [Perkinsus chesapeaki]
MLDIFGGFGSNSYNPGRRYEPSRSSRGGRLAARRSSKASRSQCGRRQRSGSPGVVELWEDLDRRLSQGGGGGNSRTSVTDSAAPQRVVAGKPPLAPNREMREWAVAPPSDDDSEVIELDDSASIGAFGEKNEAVLQYAPRQRRSRSPSVSDIIAAPLAEPDLIDMNDAPKVYSGPRQSGAFAGLFSGWMWGTNRLDTPEEEGGSGRLINTEEDKPMEAAKNSSSGEGSSSHRGLDIGEEDGESLMDLPASLPKRTANNNDFLGSSEVLPPPLVDIEEDVIGGKKEQSNAVEEEGKGLLGGLMSWWAKEGEKEHQESLNGEVSKEEERPVEADGRSGLVEVKANEMAAASTTTNEKIASPTSADARVYETAMEILDGYTDSEVISLSSNTSVDLLGPSLPAARGGGRTGSLDQWEQNVDLLNLEDAPLPRGWLAEIHSGFRLDALAAAVDTSGLPRGTVAEVSREILAHAYGLPPKVALPEIEVEDSPEPQDKPMVYKVQYRRNNSPPLPSTSSFVKVGATEMPRPTRNCHHEAPASPPKAATVPASPLDLTAANRIHALVNRKDRPKPARDGDSQARLDTIIDECKTLFQRDRRRPSERKTFASACRSPELSYSNGTVLEDSPEKKVERGDAPVELVESPAKMNDSKQEAYGVLDSEAVTKLRSPLGQFHSDLLREALRAKERLERQAMPCGVDDRALADMARLARKRFHLSQTMADILAKSDSSKPLEGRGRTAVDTKPPAQMPEYIPAEPELAAMPIAVVKTEVRKLSGLPTPARCETEPSVKQRCEDSSCPSEASSDVESIRPDVSSPKCTKCGAGVDMTGRKLSSVVKEQMSTWSWCAMCTFEMFPSISAAPKRSSFVSQRIFLGTNAEEWLWELTLESSLPVEYPEGSRVMWPTGRHLVLALLFRDSEIKRQVRAAVTVEDLEAILDSNKHCLREGYADLREAAVQMVVDLRLKQHALLKVVLKSIPNFVVELRQRNDDELLEEIVADVWNEIRRGMAGAPNLAQ